MNLPFAKVFVVLALSAAAAAIGSASGHSQSADDGVIRVKSAYGVEETVKILERDIAAKGIKFFSEIDQAKLAAEAGIQLRPSILLTFGNPPLGIQFLTADPYAGLDWPVRMLVLQDAAGQVWIAYSDFAYIARRHHIENRTDQFLMASQVAASVAASAQSKQ
ncbi:MAG: DUF302 domain-containing protein [Xanthobacteraceae bacterium]|jgi:uncharacterized protein (DUF302 family)